MNTRPTEERVVDFSGRMLGPYRLRQRVGDGGYSTVYRAEDTRDGRVVAVKVLDPRANQTDIDRFRREIELTRILFEQDGNRHVIRVFENGQDDGLRWYAMEFLEGHNLRDILHNVIGEGLRWEVAAFILQNVCYAVAKMHDREVVHRDLKPDNIILERTATGQIWVKIIDLGIAKEISIESKIGEAKYQTSRNEIPGTGPYIAPERFSRAVCTPATDQYSLGVVLYECLHGKLPFPETDNIATIARQAHGPRDGIAWNSIPRDIRDIVLRAIATDSRMRFPDVLAMGQALYRCLHGAAEYVDGQATTLRLLDRLSQRRHSAHAHRSASPGSSSDDERMAKLLANRLAAEKATQEAERLQAEREAAERLAARERQADEEKLANERLLASRREAEAVARAAAEKATTRETEVQRSFFARHGERIEKVMRRSMMIAMIAIAGMTECAIDDRWVRVEAWLTRSPGPATAVTSEVEGPVPPAPRPRLPRSALKEPAAKVTQDAVPAVPLDKAVAQASSRNSARPPKTAGASSAVAKPSAPETPPMSPPDDDLLPVGPARRDEPAETHLTEQQISRRAHDQARKLVHELCSLKSSAKEESAQVCLRLVLDRRGIPTVESSVVSVSVGDADTVPQCVLRLAKAHVKLADVAPLPKTVSPCFTVRRSP